MRASNRLPAHGMVSVSQRSRRDVRTDWSAYATAYDLLADHNPAYQQLLNNFANFLRQIDEPRQIFDVGGGTGNYAAVAARIFPGCAIQLIEPDANMMQKARVKLQAHRNISYDRRPLQEVRANGQADLVVCIHALYAMPDQERRLEDLRRLLRRGGLLYLVDLGRNMNVSEWRSYLLSHLIRSEGLGKAAKILWRGRQIAKQNSHIADAQRQGIYWTNSQDQIAQIVARSGFDVLDIRDAYRGYSDLLICRAT